MLINCNTYLGKSEIHGQGLFSSEIIKKGTPIWVKSQTDIAIWSVYIPEELRDYLDKYSTISSFSNFHVYHLDGDNAKYMNHSDDPNIGFFGETDNIGLALKDIEPNEELTCDYRKITSPEHFEYLMTNQ